MEVLLREKSPMFAFSLAKLKGRTPTWPPAERELVGEFVDGLWTELLASSPAELGYFSDAPTLIDFTYWCDVPLQPYLARWTELTTPAAVEHLADLADHMDMMRQPVDPAITEQVLHWLGRRGTR